MQDHPFIGVGGVIELLQDLFDSRYITAVVFHVNIGPFEDQLLGVGKKLPISQVLLEDSNLPFVSHALARVIFGLVPAQAELRGSLPAANVTDRSLWEIFLIFFLLFMPTPDPEKWLGSIFFFSIQLIGC